MIIMERFEACSAKQVVSDQGNIDLIHICVGPSGKDTRNEERDSGAFTNMVPVILPLR